MNKTLKVYYAKVPNMGDLLNVMLIEQLFGYKVRRHTFLTGELSAIGSGLGQFTLRENPLLAMAERVAGVLFPTVTVWGSGFVCYKEKDTPFYRRNMKFAAVRGALSKARVENLLGQPMDIPLGDAGILASYLLKESVNKHYQVGIIAHYKEQDEPIFQKLATAYPRSLLIDVRQSPAVVIRQIAQCECVISSSLHGLIIADSFGIPNIHLKVSDKLLGDGFKFDDYYSAFQLPHLQLDIRSCEAPTIEWIIEHYQLTQPMVDTMKHNMLHSFPFEHTLIP